MLPTSLLPHAVGPGGHLVLSLSRLRAGSDEFVSCDPGGAYVLCTMVLCSGPWDHGTVTRVASLVMLVPVVAADRIDDVAPSELPCTPSGMGPGPVLSRYDCMINLIIHWDHYEQITYEYCTLNP